MKKTIVVRLVKAPFHPLRGFQAYVYPEESTTEQALQEAHIPYEKGRIEDGKLLFDEDGALFRTFHTLQACMPVTAVLEVDVLEPKAEAKPTDGAMPEEPPCCSIQSPSSLGDGVS
jgi:hypothetical protein